MKIEWNETIKVWWSMIWRAFVYAVGGGFLVGALIGAICSATGHMEHVVVYAKIGGNLAALLLPVFAVKQALEKHLVRLVAIATQNAS